MVVDPLAAPPCHSQFQIWPDVVYSEFQPLVRQLIRQYGGDAEVNKDLSAEIYILLQQILANHDPESRVPLPPYIIRRLSTSVHTYARREWIMKRRQSAADTAIFETIPAGSYSTSESLAQMDDARMILTLPRAIEGLPGRQRAVVIMRYYDEQSFQTIGTNLSVTPATARSLLKHALVKLRMTLNTEGAE